MSQTPTPYGLSFFDYKGGKNRMAVSTYLLNSGYAYSIGQGDPVNMGANGYITAYIPPTTPTPPAMAIATSTTLGVFLGVSWVATNGQLQANQPYWPGGTVTLNDQSAIVTVSDLFSNVYQVQCNASLALSGTATAIGKNYNFTSSATVSLPNAATGNSTVSLDTAAGSVAAPNYWLTAKIIGLGTATQSGQTNAWSNTYADVLVLINNHTFKPGTNGTN